MPRSRAGETNTRRSEVEVVALPSTSSLASAGRVTTIVAGAALSKPVFLPSVLFPSPGFTAGPGITGGGPPAPQDATARPSAAAPYHPTGHAGAPAHPPPLPRT